MRFFQTLAVAVAAVLIFGCGGGSGSGDSSTSSTSAVSPTETLKMFVEASKKKDVAAVKSTMSKGSLELLEKVAQAQKTTADELLARGNSDMIEGDPEISNEKIEGDAATVDVKVKTTGSDTIPLVREDGVWKIAFDKYQQALVDKMRREMKPPETNSSGANVKTANSNVKNTNSKPAANK